VTAGRFERAVAFEHEVMRRTSTHVEPFAWGTAYLNDDMPHRYSSNLLWVGPGVAPPGADDLVAEADRILGGRGMGHRKVNVDGEAGRALAPRFLELGWAVHSLLVMTLERPSDRRPTIAVERVGFDVARPLAETIARRGEITRDEAVLRELVGFKDVAQRELGASFLVARVDGAPVAVCELYVGDGVAQIEDVNTLEEHRGRGIASSIVSAAAEAARDEGADLIFLVADDEDWPKHLYARLGFDAAGPAWEFVRTSS
jgi:ribosomal protein S18 acetylase RimI-like enzyme